MFYVCTFEQDFKPSSVTNWHTFQYIFDIATSQVDTSKPDRDWWWRRSYKKYVMRTGLWNGYKTASQTDSKTDKIVDAFSASQLYNPISQEQTEMESSGSRRSIYRSIFYKK